MPIDKINLARITKNLKKWEENLRYAYAQQLRADKLTDRKWHNEIYEIYPQVYLYEIVGLQVYKINDKKWVRVGDGNASSPIVFKEENNPENVYTCDGIEDCGDNLICNNGEFNKVSKHLDEVKEYLEKTLIGKDKFWRFISLSEGEAVQIIDPMAIPESFVNSYFGYDTGLDGLNLLFKGGVILPDDRPIYIAINGESGAGKTTFTLKLVSSLYQNHLVRDCVHISSFDIHYIIIEQTHANLKRTIEHFDMLHKYRDGGELISDDPKDNQILLHSSKENNLCGKFIFHQMDMYSSGQLMQLIKSLEKKPGDYKGQDHRRIYVIDSVNALMDSNFDDHTWRQELQAIKTLTKSGTSITIFVQEKSVLEHSNTVDYVSDIVLQLHKEIDASSKWRFMELVESRFQGIHFGKHPIFIADKSVAPIQVYPQTDTMHHILYTKAIPLDFNDEEKEFGVKIDGIENFYQYLHRSIFDEKPFIIKNSLTLLTGDRGCYKSKFAELFARSAFRDEMHIANKKENPPKGETREVDEKNEDEAEPVKISNQLLSKLKKEDFVELDFRLRPTVNPEKEIKYFNDNNATTVYDKAISVMIRFGETYSFQKHDIVQETHFGRLIFVRANPYKDDKGPYAAMRFVDIVMVVIYFELMDYSEDVYFHEVMDIVRAIKQYNLKESVPISYENFVKKAKFSLDNRFGREESQSNEINPAYYCPYTAVYKGLEKNGCADYKYMNNPYCLRITRLVIDNCENMVNVYNSVSSRNFLTSISHYCLSNSITVFLINTSTYGQTTDISHICSSLADTAIQFRKVALKGTWLSTIRVMRSSNNRHSGIIRQIVQKPDGSLSLKDSFQFNANFDNPGENMLSVRLVMPGSSDELRDYLLPLYNYCEQQARPTKKGVITKRDKWYNHMRNMLQTSMCHPNVEVMKMDHDYPDSFVLLDDNTYKDSCAIICIPGHLLPKYNDHLVPASNYIQFYPRHEAAWFYKEENQGSSWKYLFNQYWVKLDQAEEAGYCPCFLGKVNPTLHVSALTYGNKDEMGKSACFITPQTAFAPTLLRDEDKRLKLDDWEVDGHKCLSLQVTAMPYYIDPRLDLLIGKVEENSPIALGCVSLETLTVTFFELLVGGNFSSWEADLESILKQTCQYHAALRNFAREGIIKPFRVRDFYTNHNELIHLFDKARETKNVQGEYKYQIPNEAYAYKSWYLGVPADTPRVGTASEIITKITELNDLEQLNAHGMGIPFNNLFFDHTDISTGIDYNKLKSSLNRFENESYYCLVEKAIDEYYKVMRAKRMEETDGARSTNVPEIDKMKNMYLSFQLEMVASLIINGEIKAIRSKSENNAQRKEKLVMILKHYADLIGDTEVALKRSKSEDDPYNELLLEYLHGSVVRIKKSNNKDSRNMLENNLEVMINALSGGGKNSDNWVFELIDILIKLPEQKHSKDVGTNEKSLAFPLSHIPCYSELAAPIGRVLMEMYATVAKNGTVVEYDKISIAKRLVEIMDQNCNKVLEEPHASYHKKMCRLCPLKDKVAELVSDHKAKMAARKAVMQILVNRLRQIMQYQNP